MDRKEALSYVGTGLASLILSPALKTTTIFTNHRADSYLLPKDIFEQKYPFSLPELPYSYSSLEPAIDAETMTFHYTKHHQGYVNKLNSAVKSTSSMQEKSLLTIVKQWDETPKSTRNAVRNNGGGHLNHAIYWNTLSISETIPSSKMATLLEKEFGGFDTFTQSFTDAATSVFGSGWAWLVTDKKGTLSIKITSNQDNPLSSGYYPILGLDVWEHAYYLNYQNKRGDYIQSWFRRINWDMVEQFYQYFNKT